MAIRRARCHGFGKEHSLQTIHPIAVRILTILSLAGYLHAAPAPMNLKWSQLANAVSGQHVIVGLKDNSHVNAVVNSVEDSALTLQVTSNSHPRYKKGQVAIPRESVVGLRLIHWRARGRITLTTLGAVGGIGAGGLIALSAQNCEFIFGPCGPTNHGLEVVGVAVGVAIPVAAYFIGKRSDRQEIAILLLPD
jgi:hypothetical protein